jgi:hypothetical protein
MDVQKGLNQTETPFRAWQKTVQAAEPTAVGQGKVVEKGLVYFHPSGNGSAWDTNVDDLDKYQLMLNQQGITRIHRAYRFQLLDGCKVPTKALTVNTIATKEKFGTEHVRLKKDEVVTLYAWREGEYVQFGFKKE